MVGPELTALSARKVLGKLPDRCTGLTTFSRGIGARLQAQQGGGCQIGRTSVCHAQQVVERAGTVGARTTLYRWDHAQRRFHVVPDEEKGDHTNPAPGVGVRTAVLLVSMNLAPALSPCSTVMQRSRAW